MKVNERMKKWISMVLCLCMLVQNAPVMAFAATTDNLCEHHTHDNQCGYVGAVEGKPCTHEHSADCYAIVSCLHTCGDGCVDGCVHACTVDSGCITMEADCHHIHGDCGFSEGTAEVPCSHVCGEECAEGCGYIEHTDCGYAPATEGTPCTHVCEVKVNSADSCYRLLCSHADGGHDEGCGYAAAVEGHECHRQQNQPWRKGTYLRIRHPERYRQCDKLLCAG